jgi:heterodisulfide reductase subunit A-like polyferredoxin
MARNQSKRLSPVKIEADENGFAALQAITDYTPINPAYSLKAVAGAHVELEDLRRAEAQAAMAAAAARTHAVAKEWEFHNLMLGVKEQIIAQFGKDSKEVQALGLKRKSEYKSPRRRSAPPGEAH